jgi:hypothetical protein
VYTGRRVKYPLFLSYFNETLSFSTDFRKYSNIKLLENPSNGDRVVPCGRTDRQTDMTKLIVTFRNLASAPKNGRLMLFREIVAVYCENNAVIHWSQKCRVVEWLSRNQVCSWKFQSQCCNRNTVMQSYSTLADLAHLGFPQYR